MTLCIAKNKKSDHHIPMNLLTHHAPELKMYNTSAIPRPKIDYIETPDNL